MVMSFEHAARRLPYSWWKRAAPGSPRALSIAHEQRLFCEGAGLYPCEVGAMFRTTTHRWAEVEALLATEWEKLPLTVRGEDVAPDGESRGHSVGSVAAGKWLAAE